MDRSDVFELLAETINLSQRLSGETDKQVCLRQIQQRLTSSEIRQACVAYRIKSRGEKKILNLIDKVLKFDSAGRLLSQADVVTKF